jgi:hypothetical protein
MLALARAPGPSSHRARSSSAKVSAVTSGSRTGGHPGTVVLLGQHGIQLGAQRGLNRSAGEMPSMARSSRRR